MKNPRHMTTAELRETANQQGLRYYEQLAAADPLNEGPPRIGILSESKRIERHCGGLRTVFPKR